MKNDPVFPTNHKLANTSATPTHNQIAAKAYAIWLQNGPDSGRCIDYWFRAEQLLIQELTEAHDQKADIRQIPAVLAEAKFPHR